MKTEFSLHFFLVDLSRRKAVLLRGGPRRKGSGGIITYTFSSLSPPFPCTLEHSPFILYVSVWTTVVELAVVLLPGAVVLQALAVVPSPCAVVPREPTVVPLLRSRSTVAPCQVPLRHGSRSGCNFLHPHLHGSTAP